MSFDLSFFVISFGVLCFIPSIHYYLKSHTAYKAIGELTEQNDFLKNECIKLYKNFENARTYNQKLKTKNTDLTKINTDHQEKNKELDKKLLIIEKECADVKLTKTLNEKKYKNACDELENDLNDKDKVISQMNVNIVKLEKHTKVLEQNLEGYKNKKIEKYETKIKTLTDESEKLSTELNEKKKSCEELETLLVKLEDQLDTLETNKNLSNQPHPENLTEQIDKYKKEVLKANHFYTTMRGLKEMAEERSRNWEVSLKLLAEWVLGRNGKTEFPSEIGPLVGDALAQIDKESILGELALGTDAEDEITEILSAY